ncbi:unnamed protein product [Penicillium salamii]|uniref:Uncharacterized protein n=1 Tax=Penicillium salamii TaxID=1612424 RepID=A0A9W4ITA9_9EURO|nr:unnamed protein product [Penicillium salamii]CAG8148280.1 unnamed protein product [Penicillium salamii]CAG8149776.1 unnamed protein product [Penicillium salamii]CAG8223622.1 unnamed protein product [Penicillium salamii]CAG8264584.1 unnamed protein product [Penicillium salamii]
MKLTFASTVHFLCIFIAMVEALTRYQATPPSDAIVLIDRQALNDMAKDHPYGSLFPENGGYYLKDKDDGVVGIASDELCTELDAAFASAEAKYAQEEAAETPAPTSSAMDAAKRGTELACYPNCLHNFCSHPRCFNLATCLTYTNCHVCGSRKYCI